MKKCMVLALCLVISLVCLAAVCGKKQQPALPNEEPMGTPKDIEHPIKDRKALPETPIFILYYDMPVVGIVDGLWQSPITHLIKGGEKYRLYTLNKDLGYYTGSAPYEEEEEGYGRIYVHVHLSPPYPYHLLNDTCNDDLRSKCVFRDSSIIGVSSEPSVRHGIPQEVDPKNSFFIDALHNLLDNKYNDLNCSIEILQSLVIDLDSDGINELILNARMSCDREWYEYHGLDPSIHEDSVILAIGNVQRGVPRLFDYHSEALCECGFAVISFLDVDFDNVLEIFIECDETCEDGPHLTILKYNNDSVSAIYHGSGYRWP